MLTPSQVLTIFSKITLSHHVFSIILRSTLNDHVFVSTQAPPGWRWLPAVYGLDQWSGTHVCWQVRKSVASVLARWVPAILSTDNWPAAIVHDNDGLVDIVGLAIIVHDDVPLVVLLGCSTGFIASLPQGRGNGGLGLKVRATPHMVDESIDLRRLQHAVVDERMATLALARRFSHCRLSHSD
jgi:hypothetical protein